MDRKKELLKVGGLQMWPREIEEVLASHPNVQEVGVAGIPDPKHGECAQAWLVLRQRETAAQDKILAWCDDKLAKFKLPTEIEFRQDLPKTTVGKILRRELVREHKKKAA
jgi:long-chain acyl-CoA synthetase